MKKNENKLILEKDMQPTLKFRWIEAAGDQSEKSPQAIKHIFNVTWHYKLQQYWQSSDGEGKWRDIPIEYSP